MTKYIYFLNIIEFYKSTLIFNFALSLVSSIFIGFDGFIFTFISIGFIFSVFLKEFRNKKEYLFYYNNGISKNVLLVVSFILNLFISCILIFIYLLF